MEISYYRGVGRQRGRRFGALAQVFGRPALPFLRKYVVSAAKRVGANLLEFAAPEVGEVENLSIGCQECGKTNSEKTIG